MAESALRREFLSAQKQELGRFFVKNDRKRIVDKKLTSEERQRDKVRRLLSSREINASRAKMLLQKITTKFTQYNNEQNYLRG